MGPNEEQVDECSASTGVDERNLDSKTSDSAWVHSEAVDCIVVVVAVEAPSLDWKGFRRCSRTDKGIALPRTKRIAHLDFEQLQRDML